MLQVDQVLCLGSEALTSAVGRQTAFLAEILGSTIHVIPLNEGTPSGDLRDEPEQQYLGFSPSAKLEVVSVPGSEIRSIEAIQRYAETQEVDLVIADTHADRGLIPPLADSFVGALMRTLEQPIFCVSHAENPKEISRILVPTDLSDGSLKGLKHATGLASVYGATVDLLHVIGTSPYVALTPSDRLSLRGTSLPEHRAHRRLRVLVEAGREADIPLHSHLKFGDPADRITHFVNRETIDLVILLSHGTGHDPQHTFGQVADRILRQITEPLLLIKTSGSSLLAEEG